MAPYTFDSPLSPAVFEILMALSSGARHQYGITKQVERDSNGVVHIGSGAFHSVLTRLLKAGLVEEDDKRIDLSLNTMPRTYYQLTTRGRQVLSAELARYQALVALGYRRSLLSHPSIHPTERPMQIEHVAIWTHDLERLRAFYEAYFGARASAKYHNSRKQFASYFLSFATGARLELMQMAGVSTSRDDTLAQFTGYIILALATGSIEAVDALTARLCTDGYSVLDGPRWTGDGYYESVVQDPDGNRVEITV